MQSFIQKFRQALLSSRKHVFCLKTAKLWQAPTTTEFNTFAEILQMFPTYQWLQKCVQDFFIILLWSWAICKKQKVPGFYTFVFYIFY